MLPKEIVEILEKYTNKTDLVCNNCGKKVQWIDR